MEDIVPLKESGIKRIFFINYSLNQQNRDKSQMPSMEDTPSTKVQTV